MGVQGGPLCHSPSPPVSRAAPQHGGGHGFISCLRINEEGKGWECVRGGI